MQITHTNNIGKFSVSSKANRFEIGLLEITISAGEKTTKTVLCGTMSWFHKCGYLIKLYGYSLVHFRYLTANKLSLESRNL